MVERTLKSDERDEELDSRPTPKRKSGEHEILALYKSTLKETVVFSSLLESVAGKQRHK